ncbi:MAG: type II toxin-antitoxin system VapC family toxin [Chthoniobacterales bacterium]|nr:type II toxin-antitoxin system VapC family toxin [Chthoniobacterales bacterium]
MRYLLDTHVLLWWRADDSRLPHRWDPILGNTEDHDITFSIVSLWEIAIKRALGTLKLAIPMADFSRQLQEGHGFRQIKIEPEELDRLQTLPHHHRDPFDRLLIAQALETGAIAITNDRHWKKYRCKVQW